MTDSMDAADLVPTRFKTINLGPSVVQITYDDVPQWSSGIGQILAVVPYSGGEVVEGWLMEAWEPAR